MITNQRVSQKEESRETEMSQRKFIKQLKAPSHS